MWRTALINVGNLAAVALSSADLCRVIWVINLRLCSEVICFNLQKINVGLDV